MKIDIDSYESFEVGPFDVTLSEDYRAERLVFIYRLGDFEHCSEPFEGETLEDAKAQVAQRCITIFAEWAEEARNLCTK